MISDLLACAEQLTASAAGEPTAVALRRAVSTAYYALFHALAQNAANRLVGDNRSGEETWTRVYRGLDHRLARTSCRSAKAAGFSNCITECAASFVELQEERHKADYDPQYRLTKSKAQNLIARATWGVAQLAVASVAERQRFAVHLMFKQKLD